MTQCNQLYYFFQIYSSFGSLLIIILILKKRFQKFYFTNMKNKFSINQYYRSIQTIESKLLRHVSPPSLLSPFNFKKAPSTSYNSQYRSPKNRNHDKQLIHAKSIVSNTSSEFVQKRQNMIKKKLSINQVPKRQNFEKILIHDDSLKHLRSNDKDQLLRIRLQQQKLNRKIMELQKQNAQLLKIDFSDHQNDTFNTSEEELNHYSASKNKKYIQEKQNQCVLDNDQNVEKKEILTKNDLGRSYQKLKQRQQILTKIVNEFKKLSKLDIEDLHQLYYFLKSE